ncbi:hypothetical protein [Sphingobacterium paucimobilis]|nr:hypothetical protein [Sphingobacterium paucimobilis]
MKSLKYKLLLSLLFVSFKSAFCGLWVVAEGGNRFLQVLKANNVAFFLRPNMEDVLNRAGVGDGVLLLSNTRNDSGQLKESQKRVIESKRLKVYLEYPYYWGESRPEVKKIGLERGVLLEAQDIGVPANSIVTLNDHNFYLYKNDKPIMAIAKVAGFDFAEYGLDGTIAYPGLYREGQILVSSTALSDYVISRFGPNQVLNQLWQYILKHVGVEDIGVLEASTDVSPSFSKGQVLKADDYSEAIRRGVEWYRQSGLLVHPDWADYLQQYTKKNGEGVVFPRTELQHRVGDGSLGILEGHASYIQADGSQPIRWWIRGDCQAETAFALSSGALLSHDSDYKVIAENLLEFLYVKSNLRSGERDDPKSTSFGLIGWATTDPDAYYGDDNARALLATIGASHNLNTSRYHSYIIEGILGNFRTTGKSGFRGPWFRDAKLQTLTWESLYEKDLVNLHPHYESWLWANYLWLYDKTGYEPLKERAIKAITLTMNAFPLWKWTNGIQQEYARMLLPLSWLVRVEDTELHRYWLKLVANTLLQDLDSSGAIKERLGIAGLGRYDKVKSNEEYGSKEAPLISDYGDPVTDMLYTLNYASFGLSEAYAATEDQQYSDALQKINAFFVRSQVKSEAHPDLDGAWFRAFDFGRWDYWASNADSGWGPWGTQTGWTQSWIVNSLIAQVNKQNFWEMTSSFKEDKEFVELFNVLINSMLKLN